MKIYQVSILVLVFSFAILSCKESNAVTDNNFPKVKEINSTAKSTSLTDFSIPDGWVLFPKPSENSKERQCANYSNDKEWKVETENGNLKISKYAYEEDEQIKKLPLNLQQIVAKNRNIGEGLGGYLHIESFENGWLIGSDAGEWGGKLFWFSENGTKKIEILEDNIRGIAKIDDEIFILSGLAHLSIDDGKIYKLIKDDKANFKTQLLSDLKTQPQIFIKENNQSILIVLKNKLIRLNSLGKIEELNQTNFDSLYPNSITITSSKVIYVGMRLFIVRFVPTENGYKQEWLVPENCQKFVEKEFGCVCRS